MVNCDLQNKCMRKNCYTVCLAWEKKVRNVVVALPVHAKAPLVQADKMQVEFRNARHTHDRAAIRREPGDFTGQNIFQVCEPLCILLRISHTSGLLNQENHEYVESIVSDRGYGMEYVSHTCGSMQKKILAVVRKRGQTSAGLLPCCVPT
jgi:hypothetical protein